MIVKPDTVLRWHRDGYKAYWRWKSKGKPGRPQIPRQHIEFIRRISAEHPEWGEDRIALELKLKLKADLAWSRTLSWVGCITTTALLPSSRRSSRFSCVA